MSCVFLSFFLKSILLYSPSPNMRIVSGKYKSKRITAPKNLPVRPTTDMAKEGLFNRLNNWYSFRSIKVLDLFAGTGNISFEFLSRGTEHIVAVDNHNNCLKFINTIAKELNGEITTIKSDVLKYLEKASGSFEVVFADPPYALPQEDFETLVQLVFKHNWLTDNGTLIVEHSQQTDLAHLEHFTEARRYGSSVFSFFEM